MTAAHSATPLHILRALTHPPSSRAYVPILCVSQVTDVQALRARDIDPLNVARLVSTVFGDMTFYHGYVHRPYYLLSN